MSRFGRGVVGALVMSSLIASGCRGGGSSADPAHGEAAVTRSTSTTVDPARLGRSVWWSAARTGTSEDPSADGVVVVFTGAATIADSPECGEDYVALVEERESEVLVSVHAVVPDERRAPSVCQAIGFWRVASVPLLAPLGARTLRDGSAGYDDGRRPVFDGDLLVEPTWLPGGFGDVPSSELALPRFDDSSVLGWSRHWSGTAVGVVAGESSVPDQRQLISISQLPATELPPLGIARKTGSVRIGGVEARTSENWSDEWIHPRIEFLRDGWYVMVEGSTTGMGLVPAPTLAEIVRVAASLQ